MQAPRSAVRAAKLLKLVPSIFACSPKVYARAGVLDVLVLRIYISIFSFFFFLLNFSLLVAPELQPSPFDRQYEMLATR